MFSIRNFLLFRALHEANIPFSSLNRAVNDISLEDLLSMVPSLKIKHITIKTWKSAQRKILTKIAVATMIKSMVALVGVQAPDYISLNGRKWESANREYVRYKTKLPKALE